MLDKLLSCKSMTDITDIGKELLDEDKLYSLQTEIVDRNLVFDPESYWSNSWISMHDIVYLIKEARQEDITVRTLHTLQILKYYCPAVSDSITKLLKKITF